MSRLFLLCLLVSAPAFAADFGVVKAVKGKSVVGVTPLQLGDSVNQGDVITTGPRSFVRLLLDGGIAMNIGPDSTVRLEKNANEPATVELLKGFVLSKIRKVLKPSDDPRYRVITHTATMGVRGTTFFAKVEDDGRTFLCVCEGTVEAKWDGGSHLITAKHHDTPVWLAQQTEPAKAPMGHDHDDAEIKELEKLLK